MTELTGATELTGGGTNAGDGMTELTGGDGPTRVTDLTELTELTGRAKRDGIDGINGIDGRRRANAGDGIERF